VGNRVLRYLILISILSAALFAKEGVGEYDISKFEELFEKISATRIVTDTKEIDNVKCPFEKYQSNEYNNEEDYIYNNDNQNEVGDSGNEYNNLKLDAIFNSRAKINGNWYKLGDTILGYEIITISKRDVVLDNGENKIELQIRKKRW
jgi:hypothetical protein